MSKKYWAVKRIYLPGELTLTIEANPSRKPDYFIPVFMSRQKAEEWVGNGGELIEVMVEDSSLETTDA